jgi:tRNA pseudouridine13 synthase
VARFRVTPDDFLVDEVDAFAPTGDGEHVLFRLEKREANTDWVAQQLAHACGVSPRVVSYAGRKDRFAVTTQRFSVQMPGRESPSSSEIDIEGVRVLDIARHDRKLRTGALVGNRFRILLRDLSGQGLAQLQANVEQVSQQGAPNFFGEQRFGHGARNLDQAVRWLLDGRFKPRRNQKSMLLSAIRSGFFNAALNQRLAQGDWMQVGPDDQLQLAGSHSVFQADGSDDLDQRVRQRDICPALALPGGDSDLACFFGVDEAVAELWRAALVKQRVDASWRAIAVFPDQLEAVEGKEPGTAWVSFQLPAGAFATTVLGELAKLEEGAPV